MRSVHPGLSEDGYLLKNLLKY